MTTKTYKTRELKGLALSLTIDGKFVPVEFRSGCTIGSTATFTTSDPKIQNAMESLKMCGDVFFIEKTIVLEDEAPMDVKVAAKVEETVEEEKEVVDILDAQTFNNLVELRNALADKGIDVSQITNVKAAENIAKKNGYNYIVEKKA